MTRSTARSRVHTLARRSARASLLAAGVLLVALAALTLAARLLLPLADGYRGEVEARLADRLGRPVEIGELGLRWRARGPELRLLDVALAEAGTVERDGGAAPRPGTDGREPANERGGFRFDELLLGVDLFASVARGAPIIDELTLVGAELALVHGGGRVRLQGFDEATAEPHDPFGADRTRFDLVGWMVDARRIGLVDTTVTLSDARAGQRLTLAAVNLSAENDGTRHRLRADLSLPAALGGSVELGADLRGLRRGLARSEVDLYARGADLQLGALRETVQRLTAGPLLGERRPRRRTPLRTTRSRSSSGWTPMPGSSSGDGGATASGVTHARGSTRGTSRCGRAAGARRRVACWTRCPPTSPSPRRRRVSACRPIGSSSPARASGR